MNKVKHITFISMIAALYFATCFVQGGFASGAIQCRLSEGLTLLSLFIPDAIIGVTIGCFIFNVFFSTVYDAIFGTLATLIAGILTYLIGKFIKNDYLRIILGGLPPIILNAIVVPLILIYGSNLQDSYFYLFFTVMVGELIAVYLVGSILYFPMEKLLTHLSLINKKKQKNRE